MGAPVRLLDHLIPLFAVGAFSAFTLSQLGMVMHWRRSAEAHARHSTWVNGIGAAATGAMLGVVVVPEFIEHRWYPYLLHSHTATVLKMMLLFRGGPQVVVINAPWFLRERKHPFALRQRARPPGSGVGSAESGRRPAEAG